MNENKLIATVGLAVVVISMMTSNQLSIHASPTTEDDGWTEGDYEGSTEEQEEQAQEDWEDAGRPGDDDEDTYDGGVDDDPLPYCNTPEGKRADACHDILDFDERTGLYPCNDGTDKVDWRDCKDASKNDDDDDNDGSSSDDLPGCQNGVLQKCVIKQIGLICHPEHRFAPTNPSVVGGGHACQDIYAGNYIYEPESDNNEPKKRVIISKPGDVIGQSDDGSVLKNCGDGIIAVSCGVARYTCGDIKTNDLKDCEE